VSPTMENIHLGRRPKQGVMDDTATELRRHLPIWLAASGRVLITGLGLGCVVRGLLTSPRVEHIDVIEIDDGILRAIGAEFAGERVTLHFCDAFEFDTSLYGSWDFAWHDICCEGDGLHVLHAKLLERFKDTCRHQGAWQFPRMLKRIWPTPLLGA